MVTNSVYKTIISFSLVVRFPRARGKCRALRGDRGKPAYTGQNRFFVGSAHTYFMCLLTLISILSCLLTLAPSVNLSVDTFPDTRGRLFCMSHFFILFFLYKNLIAFFLSASCPRFRGKCRACEAIGASLRTQVRTSWQNKNNSAVILER